MENGGGLDQHGIDEYSGNSDPERPISRDTLVSAVANEQRRAILASLTRASEHTLGYDALVDRVADLIHDDHTTRASDEHRLRARIVLHHAHLPKLADAGIIEYEAGSGHVRFVGGELEQDLARLVRPRSTNE